MNKEKILYFLLGFILGPICAVFLIFYLNLDVIKSGILLVISELLVLFYFYLKKYSNPTIFMAGLLSGTVFSLVLGFSLFVSFITDIENFKFT